MASRPLILIGGGEHARVVAEAVRSGPLGPSLLGFVDPDASERTSKLELPRLGDDSALAHHPGAVAVLGIGASGPSSHRAEVVGRLSPLVSSWAVVIHQTAWVSPSASLGEGTVVMAGAVVNSGARIGNHCVVNTGVVIEHDVVLGDYVFVGPGATIGGGATIGAGAFVGLGCCVRDHRAVGVRALVGMGAVVVNDVPAGATVMGVPARATVQGA